SSTLEQSPVGLFVHAKAGLFVSFRAALALPYELSTKQTTPPPCDSCIPQPCRRACPVNALKGDHYDVAACHAHLATDAGADCMAKGCRARRACPVSQACGRVDEQSAFHMKAFFKP
ncbi:MAG: ferredoxin, partial [Pseudoruegeria sp.]